MKDVKIDLAVIGAMKSASTTITDFLRQHPDVFVPERKLLNYFSYGMTGTVLSEGQRIEATATQNAVTTKAEYNAHFADAKPGQLLSDCSDSYYFFPGTAERLHAHNPNMKIILVMREPVARAFSSFNHARSHMLETTEDFEAVMNRSLEEESELLPIRRYKALGQYGRLVQPFLDCFGTKQMHLICFEELIEDHEGTLARLTRFLDVPEHKSERVWSNPTYVPPSGLAGKTLTALRRPARWILRMSSGNLKLTLALRSLIKRIYQRPDPLDDALKQRFKPEFSDDIASLEATFGAGFYSRWR